MKKQLLFLLLLILGCVIYAQDKEVIGHVAEEGTNEPMSGVM